MEVQSLAPALLILIAQNMEITIAKIMEDMTNVKEELMLMNVLIMTLIIAKMQM